MKQASRQRGVITRTQALGSGLSEDALHRLVSDGTWKREHPSTYTLWTPVSAQERWYQQLMAGVLWLGDESAVSNRAAAVVWGLDGVVTAPLEFSTTGHQRSTRDDIFVYRVNQLSSQIVRRAGLPVTTVAQTLVGLAAFVGPRTLELAFESGLRRRLTSVERISAALESAHPRQRGRGALRFLIEQYPGTPTGSPIEVDFWRLVRDSNLPMPVRQYRLRDAFGTVAARPDFVYLDQRIAIELDSVERHTDKEDFARDRVKSNQFALLGWVPYRVTKWDLTQRPREVVDELTRLLQRRST